MDRFTAHLDRAWDLIMQGDTSGALVSVGEALEIDDESPEAHNLLGYIHALDGDVDEALMSYKQAMVLDDEYLDPILNTAELLVHPDGDPEEAIRLCRSATQLVSGKEELTEAILLEVDALLNLGYVDKARWRLADIESPESLHPSYAMLLGRAFYEAGDTKAAGDFIRRAIEHDGENADAWYYSGLIARDEGRTGDAVSAFGNVLKLDAMRPDPPWVRCLEPVEMIIGQAITSLDEPDRALLSNTEIIVAEAPTPHQIQNHVDPRQVVLAEGASGERGSFRKLWIFSQNFVRMGLIPNTAVKDLVEMILREVRPRKGTV
ncbi:MAG: tetratricopeptide repeat protein [Myxococcota bacterium]|nr:tetratricopeptide repeat protein [Myxococcota bacterium]